MKPALIWLLPFCASHRENTLESLSASFHIQAVRSIHELLHAIRAAEPAAIVLSFDRAASSTDDLLLEVKRVEPVAPVVIDCEAVQLSDAVRLVHLGAADVWTARTTVDHMSAAIRAAVESRRSADHGRECSLRAGEPWRETLVGSSAAMQRVIEVIRLIAGRRSTVLLTGETGTGKEVVARAIHTAGGRGQLPFVAVNCSAIPENLIEAELFGYTKGAFTGAMQARAGYFEQANGGTIFLDEIGDLPVKMQAKLLRVLQEREIQRLGSSDAIPLNIRVIAATNADLEQAVHERKFREDLFYRLNVIPLRLPPLRERLDDIPGLVEHFIRKVCAAEQLAPKSVTPAAVRRLSEYNWPGNIRQLEHAIEMAVVLSGHRMTLGVDDFAALLQDRILAKSAVIPAVAVPSEGLNFDEAVSTIERSLLQQALERSRGNKARAAELLQMKRTTLLAKLKA